MPLLISPISSFRIEFSILKSKIPSSPNPENKTGWSYSMEDDLYKTKHHFYHNIVAKIPSKPGYIIFSTTQNNQTKTLKILNSYENMRAHLKSLNIYDWMLEEINLTQISKIIIQIAYSKPNK